MFLRGLALLVLCVLTGCTHLSVPKTPRWLNQMNPFTGTPGDKVVLRTYLLDQPAGDPFLTAELWQKTLKPLKAEQHALLAENGLRVGHLTGNPPYQFLALARSDEAVVKPFQVTLPASETRPVPVNGPLPEVKYQAFAEIGAKAGQFTLKDAEAAMNITAVPAENGKVKLTLEPRVQHGARQMGWKPTLDATGFTWLDQKVQERFPSLKFEVTIAPEEFLLVGPSEAPANTLGGACFMEVNQRTARMRVLVVQAAKYQDAPAPAAGRKAPVIAAQASQTVATR